MTSKTGAAPDDATADATREVRTGELSADGVRARGLRADGLRTRALETGPWDTSQAIVLLHGSPGSANDWDDLLPRMGALARSIAFDLPGFGEAEKPRGWAYSPDSFARFITSALTELNVTRAHLVMSDLGGAAGVFWAATQPDAFASAVLLNTGAFIGYRWHPIARLHRIPLLGTLVALSARPGLRAAMRLFNHAPLEPPSAVIDRWHRDYDWGSRRAMLRFYRATPVCAFEQVAPVLHALDRPALVLWGAHDRFVPVAQAERQRDSFPNAEVVILANSGHFPHLDDPQGVASIILPFLGRQLR
jgi:pimeloyl-ACP methyl ester carboxylesterase